MRKIGLAGLALAAAAATAGAALAASVLAPFTVPYVKNQKAQRGGFRAVAGVASYLSKDGYTVAEGKRRSRKAANRAKAKRADKGGRGHVRKS